MSNTNPKKFVEELESYIVALARQEIASMAGKVLRETQEKRTTRGFLTPKEAIDFAFGHILQQFGGTETSPGD